MASLWIRSGLGWPERDFEVVIQTYQVGAHFEALDELVFMAPSDLRCIFLSPEPFRLSYVCNLYNILPVFLLVPVNRLE